MFSPTPALEPLDGMEGDGLSVLILEPPDETLVHHVRSFPSTNELDSTGEQYHHALLIDEELEQHLRELVRIYGTMKNHGSNDVRAESRRHRTSQWRMPGAWIDDADTAAIASGEVHAEGLLRELLRTLEPVLVKVGAALAAHDDMHHRQHLDAGT